MFAGVGQLLSLFCGLDQASQNGEWHFVKVGWKQESPRSLAGNRQSFHPIRLFPRKQRPSRILETKRWGQRHQGRLAELALRLGHLSKETDRRSCRPCARLPRELLSVVPRHLLELAQSWVL